MRNSLDSNNGCCELDQTHAVDERYSSAAKNQELCLCTPVGFDPNLLDAIPDEVIKRDYGCGNPTRWAQEGDIVLDLGSGSGKNAFICSQIVGPHGFVIGVDRNPEMLNLARKANSVFANKVGFSNVSFIESSIENINELCPDGQPLVGSSSVDLVLSNCVLNLVNYKDRDSLLRNIRRVLKPSGRVAISDIVSNKPVPIALQKDPSLWSGCISGAWLEDSFLDAFVKLGFANVRYVDRSEAPWKVVDKIEFRSVTLLAELV